MLPITSSDANPFFLFVCLFFIPRTRSYQSTFFFHYLQAIDLFHLFFPRYVNFNWFRLSVCFFFSLSLSCSEVVSSLFFLCFFLFSLCIFLSLDVYSVSLYFAPFSLHFRSSVLISSSLYCLLTSILLIFFLSMLLIILFLISFHRRFLCTSIFTFLSSIYF